MKDSFVPPKNMSELVALRIRKELLQLGTATKTEISRSTGISFPTVSKVVDQMEGEGEVKLAGTDKSSGGRRAQRYVFNRDYAMGLALYLENGEVCYTVIDYVGDQRKLETRRLHWEAEPEKLMDLMEDILREFPGIKAVSIGVPGAVKNGRIFFIPAYPKYHDVDLKRSCEERLGVAVDVENDMNAAVLGYRYLSGRANAETLVYLFIGKKGPGAGFMINGDVVRGSTFFSGEVSFVPQYNHLSFVEAIRPHLGQSSDGKGFRHPEVIDAVGRLVASVAAMINPHAFILCDENVNEAIAADIAAKCAEYVPKEHVPPLLVRDRKKDYLEGLRQIVLDRLMRGEWHDAY